jgi:hypothetical protein
LFTPGRSPHKRLLYKEHSNREGEKVEEETGKEGFSLKNVFDFFDFVVHYS